METTLHTTPKSRFPYVYELFVWFLYVSMYKYDYYLEMANPPVTRENFPYPQFILYSIAMTLYVIPFYRWLAPMLLKKKKYVLFFFTALFYFGFVSKLSGWLSSLIFYKLNAATIFSSFYGWKFRGYNRVLFRFFQFGDLRIIVTDLIAFLSLTFMRYAFESERIKHLLEKDNLVLQLESLKAQLHPHFLFNTLNNIYALILKDKKEESAETVAKLSTFMRYTLYESDTHSNNISKEIDLLKAYISLEQIRLNDVVVNFTSNIDNAQYHLPPLLFMPAVENAFKFCSATKTGDAYIFIRLEIAQSKLLLRIANTYDESYQSQQFRGGIGLENMRKRLQHYYPGNNSSISISEENNIFTITIQLNLAAQ